MGNLHTAIQWKNKLNLTFFDNYGRYFLTSKNTILQNVKNKRISLISFPLATQITTKGFEYQLNSKDLIFGKKLVREIKFLKMK